MPIDLSQIDSLRDASAFAIMAFAFLILLGFVLFRWPKHISHPIVQAIETMSEKFTTAIDLNTKAIDRLINKH